MKKADKRKLEREISAKVSEVAKLLRKRADGGDGKDYGWLQIECLTDGAVVVQATALPRGRPFMCMADEDEK